MPHASITHASFAYLTYNENDIYNCRRYVYCFSKLTKLLLHAEIHCRTYVHNSKRTEKVYEIWCDYVYNAEIKIWKIRIRYILYKPFDK